jgi:hypothetical protein
MKIFPGCKKNCGLSAREKGKCLCKTLDDVVESKPTLSCTTPCSDDNKSIGACTCYNITTAKQIMF